MCSKWTWTDFKYPRLQGLHNNNQHMHACLIHISLFSHHLIKKKRRKRRHECIKLLFHLQLRPIQIFFSQIKLNISLIECARQLCYFLQQNEIMLHGQFNFNDCRAKKRQHKERSCVGSSRKILFIECKAINASIEPIERWKINFLCPTYTQKKISFEITLTRATNCMSKNFSAAIHSTLF